MGSGRVAFAASLFLLLLTAVAPVHAVGVSIPVDGRYSVLTIRLYIPETPRWAHDVVLNASIAWNRAQLQYAQSNPGSRVYSFVETDDGTATSTISFSMPAAYAPIAEGWTDYGYAPDSRTSVVSTQTYLTPTIFNEAQGSNATAVRYAFWLALHELGRVLGLGSLLDGKDIMEPRYFPIRVEAVPEFSTIDLYALHVLAQGSAPAFVTLPDGVQNEYTAAATFLTA